MRLLIFYLPWSRHIRSYDCRAKKLVFSTKSQKHVFVAYVQGRALHGEGEGSSRDSGLEDLLVGSINGISHSVLKASVHGTEFFFFTFLLSQSPRLSFSPWLFIPSLGTLLSIWAYSLTSLSPSAPFFKPTSTLLEILNRTFLYFCLFWHSKLV